MYQVKVELEMEDGISDGGIFNTWGEACAFVEYLANESESLPKWVKMEIER